MRGFGKVALTLFVLGFLVLLQNDYSTQFKDSKEYVNASQSLIQNNSLYCGETSDEVDYKDVRLESKRSLFYPLFLLANYGNRHIVLVLQLLFVIVSFLIGIGYVKKKYDRRRVYALFSAFFFLALSVSLYPHTFMADIMLMVLVGIVLAAFSHKEYYVAGIMWSVAILVKPVMVPSALIALVLFVVFLMKRKDLVVKAYVTFLLPMLAVILISSYNMAKTGVFQYSSISTINLAHYNAKLAIASKYGADSASKFINHGHPVPTDKVSYVSYNQQLKDLGTSAIMDNKIEYFKVHSVGMFKSIVDPGRYELYSFFGNENGDVSLTELLFAGNIAAVLDSLKQSPVLLILLLFLTLLGLIKALGFALSLGEIKKEILLILICVYFVGIAGPIGASRFLIPSLIPFTILAAVGIDSGLRFFKKRSKG
jgi:hypothetical protein